MDRHAIRPLPRFRADARVPGVFGGLLRRSALCHEGRFASDRGRTASAVVSQLVPPALSVCVRRFSLCGRSRPMNARTSPDAEVAAFARDIRASLSESPRHLPSRYLYDTLGSALFEAICALPWYRLTRAESALLERHGPYILAACAPLRSVVELGPGNGAK